MRTTSPSRQKPLNPEIPTEQPSLLYIYMHITNVQIDLTRLTFVPSLNQRWFYRHMS